MVNDCRWVVHDGASEALHRALMIVALVTFALMALLGATLGLGEKLFYVKLFTHSWDAQRGLP